MRFLGERPPHDLTYSDVFLVPTRSGVSSRLDVDLSTGDGTGATIPIVAANMNSVTGPRLAATLARRGGLGVLPQDLPLQELDAAIRWVKEQPVHWDTPLTLPPSATVADALALLPAAEGHGIVLREDEVEYGAVPATRLATALPDARLGDLVHGAIPELDDEDVDPDPPSTGCRPQASISRSSSGTAASSARRAPAAHCAARSTTLLSTPAAGCGSRRPSASTAMSRARPRRSPTRVSTCSSSTPRTGIRRACCARSTR
ncbi:hypothetical protein GCM10025881_05750 [Pseudolysinimonas kribbensis]|uniref:GMP reductase n=1 Tax=Pseudolysinimonas kribbensis TaxID=433641 RepID=A0ABQ6K1W8_9MICO|nr:hypothetical protein GCM10025881_05750 [Pseudolysinimonas kribbensis]